MSSHFTKPFPENLTPEPEQNQQIAGILKMPHPGHRSLSFPSCFRTTAAAKTVLSANSDLTTSLYQTQQGLFGLTWSKGPFGTRSLHIYLLLDNHHLSFPPSPSFHLQFNPRFAFWKKRGSKTLVGLPNTSSTTARVFWDLSRAKFGSRPDPASGYYVAIFIGGEMTLLVGVGEELLPLCQLPRSIASSGGGAASARAAPKETAAAEIGNQVMVLRREHVYGDKKRLYYTTRAKIGGGQQEVDVTIDYRAIGGEGGPTLCFSIADKRVLQVKHLKWKFRGNERVELDDGIPPVQVSWDVYNWLFVQDDDQELKNGYALFMFKFEKKPGGLITEEEEDEEQDAHHHHHDYSYYDFFTNSGSLKETEVEKNKTLQQDCGGLNLVGFETKKRKKKKTATTMMKRGFKMRSGRSWSSSSLSSVSSSSSSASSVMEWASVEENELKWGPCGFSLVVYAWN